MAALCSQTLLHQRAKIPMTDFVTLYEVGPRDGLQNEAQSIGVDEKCRMVEGLAAAGVRKLEVGSFVSPKWVPQMADSDKVFAKIKRLPQVTYSALTPNERGIQAALQSKVDEVAIFAAASESFSQKNINCSIAESIERFKPVIELANEHQVPVRGYVSCIVGCPYEGEIDPHAVAKVSAQLMQLGCYEISLGDTIGVGTPKSVKSMLDAVISEIPASQLAIHCHDTYGQANANVCTALEHDIRTVDASVAGLGGCPYAKGASGNVASEDVLYLLNGLGLQTDIDLNKMITVGNAISSVLGKPTQSKVARALSSNNP